MKDLKLANTRGVMFLWTWAEALKYETAFFIITHTLACNAHDMNSFNCIELGEIVPFSRSVL